MKCDLHSSSSKGQNQRDFVNFLQVCNVAFSNDSRWITVTTRRGTSHVFPVTSYGGQTVHLWYLLYYIKMGGGGLCYQRFKHSFPKACLSAWRYFFRNLVCTLLDNFHKRICSILLVIPPPAVYSITYTTKGVPISSRWCKFTDT